MAPLAIPELKIIVEFPNKIGHFHTLMKVFSSFSDYLMY